MAKSKTSQPIKSIPKPGLVSTDTGIYSTTAIDASSPASLDVVREMVAAAGVRAARASSLEEVGALREQLRAAIRSAIHKDETPLKAWATVTADLGEGTQGYVCDTPPDAGIKEAEAALNCVDFFLMSGPTEREAEHFLLGMTAGQYVERRYVRTKGHHALQGKAFSRSQSDRRKGGTLTPEEATIVQGELKRRMRAGASKQSAAKNLSALLLKGEVEGIDRPIEYSAERIRKLPG